MRKYQSILGIALLAIGLNSCQPEPGCMDVKSRNYSTTAEEDDGSCEYDGTVVFWIDANTSMFMQNNYIQFLKVYVNGSLVGTMSTVSAYVMAPNCFEGGITYFEDLGTEDSKMINFEIKIPGYFPGDPDIDYSSSNILLSGGDCVAYRIQ